MYNLINHLTSKNNVKYLELHSHNYLLLCITEEENFIINKLFIFNLYFLRFVVEWITCFYSVRIFFSLISIFCFEYIWICLISTNKRFVLYPRYNCEKIKQIFETINLKFKTKLYLCVGGRYHPSQPPVSILLLKWIKYLKLLFNSGSSIKILRDIKTKFCVEMNGFDPFWITLYIGWYASKKFFLIEFI